MQPEKTPKAEMNDPDVRRAVLVQLVTDKYLKSSDFNGFPIRQLRVTPTLKDDISSLIEARALDLIRGDNGFENPHIKAFPAEPTEIQLQKIVAEGLGHGCLYPTPEALAKLVQRSDYDGRPFSLELALGACQLEFRPFRLVSLEYYRNDPRFRYNVDDIHGSIVYDDAHFDEHSPPEDRLVMNRFGFCHSQPDLKRAVAVLLRDLHKLEPKQQQHWKRHELKGEFRLHPAFQAWVLGDFVTELSICDAFLEEKHQINIISELMGRAPFFKTNNQAHDRPDGFHFLIRPTQKELRAFKLLLDQLLSDDINPAFFHELETHRRGTDEDGKPMTQQKGTIQLLQEWLEKVVRFPDPGPKDEMLCTLRHIRQQRMSPAHKAEKDVFDDKFFDEQRQLIIDAHRGVQAIRLILQNHPKVRGHHEVPRWLDEGKFWTR